MTYRKNQHINVLATAFIGLATVAYAQTTVTLEDASVNKETPSAPINISLGGTASSSSVSVSLSPANNKNVEPVKPDTPIVLTKPSFQKEEPKQEVGISNTGSQDIESTSALKPDNETSATVKIVAEEVKSSLAATETAYFPPSKIVDQQSVSRNGVELPVRPEQLKYKPLEMTVPDVSKTTLTNGMRFYHYESKDLPRVQIRFILNAGGMLDPDDKVGLAELTARTLRSGGVEGMSPDEFDEKLDSLGSEITINADREYVSGEVYSLTRNTEATLDLVRKLFLKPTFDEKKFEQEKAKIKESLRRQNDQPDQLSRREFRKIVYGKDSVLARTITSSSLEAINLDDVRKFYGDYYRPKSFWVGVSGDISKDDAVALLEKHFGEWKADAPTVRDFESEHIDEVSTGGIYFTEKDGAQSQIRIGHLGLIRKSPDSYAANVFNSIYGTGGFSSRLMNRVRTKNGYAYGVGGGLMSDTPKGLFAVVASTQSGTTAAAIKEILNVTNEMLGEVPTESEIDIAKKDIISSFFTQFSTPKNILAVHMLYDFRGYDADYLKTFVSKIQAVSADEVLQTAKKYINPDNLKIYIVGKSANLDAPLESLGTVTKWDVEEY